MRHFHTKTALSALLAAALAMPAAADISAEDAWGTLRDMMTGSGYTSAGTESRDGSDLVVSDAVFSITIDDQSTTSIDMGTLRFSENGDGTVSVDMPEVMPVISQFAVPDQDTPVTLQLDVLQSDAKLLISGSPENWTQAYDAATVEVALISVDGAPESLPPDAYSVSMKMTGLSSSTTVKGQEDPRPAEMTATAESIEFSTNVAVPGEAQGMASGQMSGLTFEGTATLPTQSEGGDMAQLIADGYTFDGSFKHNGGGLTVSGEDDSTAFAYQSQSDSGVFDVTMTGTSVGYKISQIGSSLSATLPDLPFPVSMEADGIDLGFLLPLTESETPSDFSLLVNLQAFQMSDMIWSLFDPQSILPRDPATLLVDLAGKATVFINLMDPTQTAALETTGEAPGQLDALDIKALELKLVGAELNGTGAFTFDNTDLATFGGMPRPVGALDLQLAGGNGLIDKLTQMGLIGEQEAGSARMMMGLLAVPGEAPDTLNSTLEINDQGHIIANGQRIQ
ncbi:MAG: hypothetical protein AAGF79_05750 [Pseudomonadota bacterium]